MVRLCGVLFVLYSNVDLLAFDFFLMFLACCWWYSILDECLDLEPFFQASFAEVNTTPKSRSKFEVQSQGDIEVSETLPTLVTDLASPSSNLDEIATSNIDVASNIVDMVPKPGSLFCLESESAISSCISVAEAGPGPESPVANGNADKPVDSLSEWLDVESPAMCSPEIQSARTEVKQIEVDALTSEVVSHSLPPKAAEVSESPLSDGPHRRRKSWQGSGNLSTTPFAEKPSRSHKHTLSADAAILNVRCGGERSLLSVVDKVKLFTVLAESGGVTSTPEENSLSGSEEIVEDKGTHQNYPRMFSCFTWHRPSVDYLTLTNVFKAHYDYSTIF